MKLSKEELESLKDHKEVDIRLMVMAKLKNYKYYLDDESMELKREARLRLKRSNSDWKLRFEAMINSGDYNSFKKDNNSTIRGESMRCSGDFEDFKDDEDEGIRNEARRMLDIIKKETTNRR